ncbi:MAG: hypothetical protein EOM23_03865 [Candidatus Moranbacteria bacterium]|nr:hypothetical protein [Candidatus Moranbacteria bacterium]
MKFDIEETLKEMLAAMKGVAEQHWKDVESTASGFLQRRKERLEMIAILRINGELSPEKFKSRLEDEKLILEAELNALAVLSKAITQKAVNSAIEILEKTVEKAISTIL